MADFPGSAVYPPSILSTYSWEHSGVRPYANPTAGAKWPAANRAIYCPVLVEVPVTVTKMAVWPTVQSGNMDVGIYSETGTRLVSSGSTAVGAAATLQSVDITDTLLNPGVYYLAMCVDNTTAAFQSANSGAVAFGRVCGLQNQAVGAVTLPATATFANPSNMYLPLLQALVMSAVI